MNESSRKDVRDLAERSPIINAAINLIKHKGVSWEEAMNLCVCALAQHNEELLAKLLEHEKRSFGTEIRPYGSLEKVINEMMMVSKPMS